MERDFLSGALGKFPGLSGSVEANGNIPVRFRGSASHRRTLVQALLERNRTAGLDIDAKTARCRWYGETMDYGLAIEHLIQVRNGAIAPRVTHAPG